MTRDVFGQQTGDAGHRPAQPSRILHDDSGQDLIEYGLLAAVISVAFVGTIQAVSAGVDPFFTRVLAAFASL